MANLGNTIINGALRVNGKINTSDVISAPSFVGALTGNADTATKLKTARTINGVSFDGSANIQIPYLYPIDLRTSLKPSNITNNRATFTFSSFGGLDGNDNDNHYVDGLILSSWANDSGGNVNAIIADKQNLGLYHYYGAFGASTWSQKKKIAYIDSNITGNANTATKLATARTINGVSFDGSANITVADSTKLPLAGGTLTGKVKLYNSDASTGLQSGQLTIGSTNSAYNGSTGGGDVAIELWRGTNASWQILNNGGYLYFKNNYTTAIQSSYSQVALKMNYNTGDATFYGNISPDANNTGTLGTSSMKWNNVYATTFTGALSGNATSATNTAITNTNPTSGTWYYPTWVSGTSGNLGHRVNNGYQYYALEGTTSATGRAILQLGNSTATGTAGNKCGEIIIYNQNKGYTAISGTSSASNFAITLPAASGTVALTSHTHSAATTSANGFMSSADKTKLNALHYVRSGTAVPDSSLGENGDIYILLES